MIEPTAEHNHNCDYHDNKDQDVKRMFLSFSNYIRVEIFVILKYLGN